MIYAEQFGGYIADNPDIDFERCDGRIFHYDEVNTWIHKWRGNTDNHWRSQ